MNGMSAWLGWWQRAVSQRREKLSTWGTKARQRGVRRVERNEVPERRGAESNRYHNESTAIVPPKLVP